MGISILVRCCRSLSFSFSLCSGFEIYHIHTYDRIAMVDHAVRYGILTFVLADA